MKIKATASLSLLNKISNNALNMPRVMPTSKFNSALIHKRIIASLIVFASAVFATLVETIVASYFSHFIQRNKKRQKTFCPYFLIQLIYHFISFRFSVLQTV